MTFFVANSTPMVDLLSRLNSLRVKRLSKLDLPTCARKALDFRRLVGYSGRPQVDEPTISDATLSKNGRKKSARLSRTLLPTPESPMSTTLKR